MSQTNNMLKMKVCIYSLLTSCTKRCNDDNGLPNTFT